jgi:transposase
MRVAVVFFAVTTFSFESQHADTLPEFGFSKDEKMNEVQVVLALLINKAGRPISFEVFPGHTFEGHTFVIDVRPGQGVFSD